MKYSNTIEYNIKTSLDSKGLAQLKSELQGLELKLQNMGNKGFLNEKSFSDARDQIQGLGQALSDAFNPSLGMLDLSKLNQELKNNGVTAQGLKTAFSSLGAEGQVAFNNLVGELGKLDTGILRTNSQIDKLFTTFSNTFRWGLVSSFFSQFMNAIHSSVDYVKELDDSLTQIMLVTDYNRDSMNQFAKSANEAAKAVSMTTTGMTNASLIFAQQGYDLGQSQELATLSAKLANASQQDTATTSDQITAYMNAYGLENSIEELTQQMDNWALIANVSAADVGELAQASQRAASMANAVGVSGEQLASQIATIESVTREAPEQIGNGLKTLYARFSDIAAGGEDEDGFTLGKVTSQLDAIGVQVFDKMGQIRDVGDIMEDLMVIWDDLDQTSKVAASQALAGKYQVNRFMALMDNSDMYEEYKGVTGSAATGTLDQMSEEFADSIEGRSAKLQASLEGLFSTIFNTDDIYPWMDAAQDAVDLLQQFFDALGGGKTVLLGISSLLMQIFSKNMAQEINNAATNRAVQQQKIANLQHSEAALTTMGLVNPNPEDQNSKNILEFAQYMNKRALEGGFNAEQMNQANAIYEEMIQNANTATMANEKLEQQLGLVGTVINSSLGESGFAPFADFSKAINSIDLKTVLGDLSDKTLTDFFANAQEEVKEAKNGLLGFNKTLQEYSALAADSGTDTEVLQEKMNELQNELKELSNYLDDSTFKRYDKALDEIANDTEAAVGKTDELATSTAKLATELDNATAKGVKKAFDDLQKTAFQSANADIAAEDANATRLAFQESNEKTDYTTNILNTLNAVQQLTFAWQAFQNLGSLWANEDLSTGEKVLQTIMNLTMAMPQLISAMQTLQGNSFLQNVGNGLMGALNGTLPTVGDFEILGQESIAHLDGLKKMIEDGDKAKATMQELVEAGKEIPDEMRSIAMAGDEARRGFEAAKAGMKGVVDESAEAITSGGTLATVFGKGMAAAATEGATGLGVLAGGLKAVAAEAWAFITGPAAPFIIAGAAIAAIAVAIGQAQEQAKKAHEQAVADFEEAKKAQQQVEEFSTKIDDWKSKRQQNGDSKELAQEADELADSLREAGYAAEANSIALAAARAEAQDTAEGYEALDQTLTNVKNSMSEDSYIDAMNKAQEILKDQLSTIEEINAAKELLLNSGGQLGMQRLAETEGQKMHVYDAQDEATQRAGTEALTAATASWKSIDQYLKEIVPGYANIADEAERLAKAQEWATTEAQKAVITTRQLLLANQNLTERGGAYDARNDYTTTGREGILNQLRNGGFTAEEQLKIIASFDEDATDQEITEGISKIQEQLKTNPDLTLAIRASLSEEDIQQSVERQLASYQPKDEDVSQEDFQRLTDTFYENKEKMGEKGTPFEDFSETLFSNADALERLIEGILRYNDAIASIDENYDKWNDALEANNIFSDEYQDTMEDLQDTYSDFLDLSEDLSKDFLSNAKNLEKLKEASEGVEGSYEDLEKAAKEDIYMTVTDTDDLDVAEEKINEIYDLLDNPEYEAIDVGEVFDISSIPGLEASINNFLANFKGSAEEAVAAVHAIYGIDIPVNNIAAAGDEAVDSINAISSTADNAVGTVSAMANGVAEAAKGTQQELTSALTGSTEVEIDGKTATATDNVQYTNLIPRPGETTTITSYMPVGNGNTGIGGGVTVEPFVAEVTGVAYDAESIDVPQPKDMTGQTVKTEYKPGDTGGGFSLKPGAMGTKAAPSGAKRAGGAHSSSPGGSKGSCFVAGTLITTLTGFKPIEEIQKGDIVLSYNEKIKANEYSEVLQTMVHDTIEPIYTLHIKDEQLRVTGIHRFLVIDKITCGVPQWVHATDLKVGNWIMFADGSWHVIYKIDINIEHRTVYNFEVSHNHNYYVGRNQILAHNKGGKSCFVAGTQISTINGFRVIESIQPNDIVLSYNEQTKCNEYSSVIQTMIHDTKEPIYTLYIQNEQLRVTGIHRFFVTNNIINGVPEWIAAENLRIGQWVLFADGTWHVIHKIEINIEHQTVYNFEVSGNHNYYVGRNQILAHNKGGKGKKSCFVAGTQVSTSLGFKPIETIQSDDIVLSYNEQTGHNEYSSVIQTMIHDTVEPIYTLYVQNEKLRVTGVHRFFITKNILTNTPQWIAAEKLRVGDWVLLANGTWHVIWKIEINIEHQTVYNFEVSGNHNYYVGYNQILAHNKGGGKNQKEIKNKEKKEHEKDYYEEVNTQLDKTEKMLSKIEKEEDRLIGDKARANQNKQISYLKKQYLLLSNKRDIQKEELKDVDTLLKKREKEARNLAMKNHVKFDIPEAVYDGEGAIANYEEMSAAIDKIHNQLIDKYNKAAKAGNEKTTKALEETISKFDKYGEDILKNAKRHDKLQVELQDTENQLEEINNQIEDIRIEAYKTHQEALDELKDLKEEAGELAALFRDFNDEGFMTKWSLDDTPMDDMIKSMYELDNIYNITKEDANDFYQDLINKKQDALNKTTNEDEKEAIQASINYFKQQQANLSSNTLQNGLLGLANQDLQQLQGWIDGTNTEFNPFGENEAALWEAYEDAYKRSIELFKDWRETIQDLRDSIIDTYDEQEDAIERNIDNYDRILDHLERINDTYTLYYGENSYDGILNIMDQQGATMEKQLADLTTAFDYWSARYQEALKTGDQKLIQEIKAKMDDAQEAMYDKAEELAEHWVERYEKAIDASIQKIDTKLWGGGPGQMDLEDQTMIWELQKDYMDNYKDDVEKAYEIDKLRSKYTDLLNDAQGMSLQTQNKIRAQMQEQLDLLQNQTTMSEYDVKLANARLEILQKQIALEDAQRNKNKMQLRRDTQGNYRYVYTADQGDVKQAQDELNESEFNAYEITKEQTIANNDRAINLYQDYMNKMRDIANKYKDDDVARNAAMKALSEEYGKLLEALGEDFKDTTNGMYDVLVWLVENGTKDTSTAAKDMLDQLYDKNGEVKENTGNDWRDLATQISQEVLPNIEEAVSEGLDNISRSADSLKDQMTGDNGVLTKIGSSTDTLKQSMEEATEQTEKWAKATRDLFESFSPDNVKVQEAMSQLTSMSQQLSQNQQATSALSTAYKTANQKLQSKTAEARAYQTAYDYATGAKNFKKGDTVTIKKGTYVTYNRDGKTQYDDDKNVGFYLPQDFKVKIHHTDEHDHGHISRFNIGIYPTGSDQAAWGKMLPETFGKDMYTSHLRHEMWHINENTARQSLTFDTGGYTGDWNGSTDLPKNGKWAVLHQKELVLNAADTKNILAAVSFMREMFGTNMTGLKEFARLDPSRISDNYNPMTEQRVEIQATFPNATDADDIRTALLELSDKAYQYAHRTI